jgi:DNA excision repair protein ERCC-4
MPNKELGPVRIVADDRENAGGVVDELRAIQGVLVTVQRLPRGDFLVQDSFAVERKTLRDFAASTVEGRLFRQAAALVTMERRSVLILEGTLADAQALRLSRDAIQGALITVSVFYGLTVLRARDSAETARLLLYIGRQAQQFANGALPRPGYRPKGKRARQLFILQGLPGVGPDRAAQLLNHFGSVQAVANAARMDLSTAEGIGESTAAKIHWALEEPPSGYKAASPL